MTKHGMATALAVMLVAAATSIAAPATAGPKTNAGETLWVGHQYVLGRRTVPFLGALQTRTDTFLVARVRQSNGGIELVQHTCRIEFAKVAGGRVVIAPQAVRRMPRARIVFTPRGKLLHAKPWRLGWGSEDIDKDGKPGLTVTVKAPLCGGDLQVGSRTVSIARGLMRRGRFIGQIAVSIKQKVLGASGRCLRVVARDSSEQMIGYFAYKPAPAGTTCESLIGKRWPVKAPSR